MNIVIAILGFLVKGDTTQIDVLLVLGKLLVLARQAEFCKGTGWIEILGGGIVNRKVLENCGVDPDKYTGFAFGLGLDRIAMLKNGVNNIHVLYEGDLRALEQFKG